MKRRYFSVDTSPLRGEELPRSKVFSVSALTSDDYPSLVADASSENVTHQPTTVALALAGRSSTEWRQARDEERPSTSGLGAVLGKYAVHFEEAPKPTVESGFSNSSHHASQRNDSPAGKGAPQQRVLNGRARHWSLDLNRGQADSPRRSVERPQSSESFFANGSPIDQHQFIVADRLRGVHHPAAVARLVSMLKSRSLARIGLEAPRMYELLERQHTINERMRRAELQHNRIGGLKSGGHFNEERDRGDRFTPNPLDLVLRAVFTISLADMERALEDIMAPIGAEDSKAQFITPFLSSVSPLSIDDLVADENVLKAHGTRGKQNLHHVSSSTLRDMVRRCVNPVNINLQKRQLEERRSMSDTNQRDNSAYPFLKLSATGDASLSPGETQKEFACWVTVEVSADVDKAHSTKAEKNFPLAAPALLLSTHVVFDGSSPHEEPLWEHAPFFLNNDKSNVAGHNKYSTVARKAHGDVQRAHASESPLRRSEEISTRFEGLFPAARGEQRGESVADKLDIPSHSEETVVDNSNLTKETHPHVLISDPESPSGHLLARAEGILKQLREHYFSVNTGEEGDTSAKPPSRAVLRALNDCNVLIVKAATHMHNLVAEAARTADDVALETEKMRRVFKEARGARLSSGAEENGGTCESDTEEAVDAYLDSFDPDELMADDAKREAVVAEVARRQQKIEQRRLAKIAEEVRAVEERLSTLESLETQSVQLAALASRDTEEEVHRNIDRILMEMETERVAKRVDAATGSIKGSRKQYGEGEGEDGVHTLFGEVIGSSFSSRKGGAKGAAVLEMTEELGFALVPLSDIAERDAHMNELTNTIRALEDERHDLESRLAHAEAEYADLAEFAEFEKKRESDQRREELQSSLEELEALRQWKAMREASDLKEAHRAHEQNTAVSKSVTSTGVGGSRRPSFVNVGVQFESLPKPNVHSRSVGVTPQPSSIGERRRDGESTRVDRAVSAMPMPNLIPFVPTAQSKSAPCQTDVLFRDIIGEAFAVAEEDASERYSQRLKQVHDENDGLRAKIEALLVAAVDQKPIQAPAMLILKNTETQCTPDDIAFWTDEHWAEGRRELAPQHRAKQLFSANRGGDSPKPSPPRTGATQRKSARLATPEQRKRMASESPMRGKNSAEHRAASPLTVATLAAHNAKSKLGTTAAQADTAVRTNPLHLQHTLHPPVVVVVNKGTMCDVVRRVNCGTNTCKDSEGQQRSCTTQTILGMADVDALFPITDVKMGAFRGVARTTHFGVHFFGQHQALIGPQGVSSKETELKKKEEGEDRLESSSTLTVSPPTPHAPEKVRPEDHIPGRADDDGGSNSTNNSTLDILKATAWRRKRGEEAEAPSKDGTKTEVTATLDEKQVATHLGHHSPPPLSPATAPGSPHRSLSPKQNASDVLYSCANSGTKLQQDVSAYTKGLSRIQQVLAEEEAAVARGDLGTFYRIPFESQVVQQRHIDEARKPHHTNPDDDVATDFYVSALSSRRNSGEPVEVTSGSLEGEEWESKPYKYNDERPPAQLFSTGIRTKPAELGPNANNADRTLSQFGGGKVSGAVISRDGAGSVLAPRLGPGGCSPRRDFAGAVVTPRAGAAPTRETGALTNALSSGAHDNNRALPRRPVTTSLGQTNADGIRRPPSARPSPYDAYGFATKKSPHLADPRHAISAVSGTSRTHLHGSALLEFRESDETLRERNSSATNEPTSTTTRFFINA